MHGDVDVFMDGCMRGCKDVGERMDGWMGGWMGGWVNGWMDRCVDGCPQGGGNQQRKPQVAAQQTGPSSRLCPSACSPGSHRPRVSCPPRLGAKGPALPPLPTAERPPLTAPPRPHPEARRGFGGQHPKSSGTACERQLPPPSRQHGPTWGSFVISSAKS